ncbi:hypothetical protein GPECTOR_13g744 [Gonium pectorale]|uniref:ABC transporter domain-containing protein n=1 Tax=Gonium pectorale TaxID=33097 RepID=A0A150GN65_GONPE|nr:hypothetical protein GPECTOR_13g744 [Gonium pectorale]|eukprot:KXZ51257.1 hypothetical protein GPECTOR_13g744 [Gonium pectorale]
MEHPLGQASGLQTAEVAVTIPASEKPEDHADDHAAPINLAWKDLTVTAKRANRPLLNGVTGKITSGFYSIMASPGVVDEGEGGPSGSGKTTLLNTLACRLDHGVGVAGEFKLNGNDYSNAELKKMSGYVMQDDLLNPHLTAEETLRYTAELRMPRTSTPEERAQRVQEVMGQVGLSHVRDVIVGSPMKKGISGGERKRLCVAMELLTKPALLFLDEPTSGLDSVTALSLCRLLRRLASSKTCTVVCTIHQDFFSHDTAKIFALFDQLLLLNRGNIVYQGPAQGALDFFDRSGFPCPAYENPADHFLDVIMPNANDSVESLVEKDRQLSRFYSPPNVEHLLENPKPLVLPRDVTPWHVQFRVLLRRSLKETWRKRSTTYVLMLQTVIIAVLIGTVFLRIGTDQKSTVRRQPVLFFTVINQGMFGALIVINSFPSERMLSLRERAAGTYHCSAYFLAKVTAETISQLPAPILFSCVVYFLVGLQPVASKFFIYMALMVLCSTAATSLALAVSAIARTTDMAVTILPMALEICRLFGGFFLSPANLPKYFSWLDALSYVKYTYVGISLNELHGLELHCTPSQLNSAGKCPITSGEQTIKSLGLDYIGIADCVGILIAYIVICRVIAYLGVRYLKH